MQNQILTFMIAVIEIILQRRLQRGCHSCVSSRAINGPVLLTDSPTDRGLQESLQDLKEHILSLYLVDMMMTLIWVIACKAHKMLSPSTHSFN